MMTSAHFAPMIKWLQLRQWQRQRLTGLQTQTQRMHADVYVKTLRRAGEEADDASGNPVRQPYRMGAALLHPCLNEHTCVLACRVSRTDGASTMALPRHSQPV
eukprot:343940-Chlamydomonas_euryale.AAC.6